MVLHPITRHSVSQAAYEQIRDQILSGQLRPGSALPSERQLCARFKVNRSAVREAIKRLEQARLIAVRHGGASRVLDFRSTAGLDLLVEMLPADTERFDPAVVRGVVEMRSALAPDIVRLAARRGGAHLRPRLTAIVTSMRQSEHDLMVLQILAADFWTVLVEGCDNLAYRLAYNSMREVYTRFRGRMLGPLASELKDVDAYAAITAAVVAGDESKAERHARDLIRRGEAGIVAALYASAVPREVAR